MVGLEEWLEPWWLERQLDPRGPDFVPGRSRHNVTHRSWTLLGNLGSHERGAIDPRGLVTVADRSWSLDWWVGADDRWHLPSREAAVRQRLVEGSPVVETAMRVPGGDARHRAFAFRSGDHEFVAVEVTNDTAVPFALALAIRPAHLAGTGAVRRIELDDDWVLVDGLPALVFAKRPSFVAGSDAVHGDVVHVVTEGMASSDWDGPVQCPEGRATAAFVFPLPHTATLRAVLPLGVAGREPRPAPTEVPAAAKVAHGWAAHAATTARVALPDQRLQSAFDAARRHLLLFHAGEDVVAWPARQVRWTETATVVTALDQLGHHVEAEQVLSALPDRQALDGQLIGADDDRAANGAALHAVAEHWRLTRDAELLGFLTGPLAKAGHWIDKRRRAKRGRRLLDGTVADLLWCIGGLRGAADALAGVGQPEVAADFELFASLLVSELRAAGDRTQQRWGVSVLPSTIDGTIDGRLADNLVASWIGAVLPDDPQLQATAEWVRQRADVDGALFDLQARQGTSARATALLADLELAQRDERGVQRLGALLAMASPTWTWPEVTHPRSGGGSFGDGDHGATTATFCSLVRRLVVSERDHELVLCPVVPESWLGVGWEIHDVPTRFGRLGYAVRWHGERPALLWELDLHPGLEAPTLRIPGLDPSWEGGAERGDALLSPVRRVGADDPTRASSGSFG
jgi:hypothetical protein